MVGSSYDIEMSEISQFKSGMEAYNNVKISGIALASQFEDLSPRMREKVKRVRRLRDRHFHNNDYTIKRKIPKAPNRYEGKNMDFSIAETPANMPEEILGGIRRVSYDSMAKKIIVEDKKGKIYAVVEDGRSVDMKLLT